MQILLEELALAYGTQFTVTPINIFTNEQKKDWFLRLNPNGKIPVLLDSTKSIESPKVVFESAAVLIYLAETYDKDFTFSFQDAEEKSELLQWLFFWHGNGGPIMGQMVFFGKFAKEKLPFAIDRFRTEVLRVFGVLELRLSNKLSGEAPREYLVGNKYSIADINAFAYVKGWEFGGLAKEQMEPFPHVMKWLERIATREAVKVGTGDKYAKR